ncbi:MAG TPA: tetratricopeptide repeat protein, partial [Candidatus Paceibacterota bacterium]
TIRGIQLVGVDRKTGEPALVYPSVDYNRKFFEDAIAENSFGTPEATQQFVSTAGSVLSISNLPAESKERFLASAEKAILSLVAARPDDSRVRALAGNFYGRLQLYSQAIEHLEAGVALAPRKQSVRIPLAATYFAQGQTERAVAFAGETYDINHNNDSAWLALVRLAARLPDSATFDALIAEAQAEGRHDRVVSYAELSVSSNPGEPQNRAALAKALADAGRHDDAVAVLETAKADFPKLASQFDAMIVQIETLKKAN